MLQGSDNGAQITMTEQHTDSSALSSTQAALRHAVEQLDELAGSDDQMQHVRAQLEQQTEALLVMQRSLDESEAEKAREHEQTLSRSVPHDTCALGLSRCRMVHHIACLLCNAWQQLLHVCRLPHDVIMDACLCTCHGYY